MAKAVRIHSFGDHRSRYETFQSRCQSRRGGRPDRRRGVNFIDVYHRTGLYPISLPLTLGQEALGTVVTVGHDVRR